MYQGLLPFGTLIIHLLLSINVLDSHISSIYINILYSTMFPQKFDLK